MAAKRGILGVKKDPKNQILFSFQTRDGEEWPSDDSGDSDYEPTQAEAKDANIEISPRKKRKLTKRINDKKESAKNNESSEDEYSDIWTHRLPPELLLKIFQYITDQEGAIPFLRRASRVCTSWTSVTKHPTLWKKVDLSYGWIKSVDATLKYLCPNRLTRVQALNLSAWKNLTEAGLECIAEHCPLLQSLDISHCTKVKGQSLQMIAKNCRHLAKLDISFLNQEAVNPQTMKYVLQTCGKNLLSLEMGGNRFKSMTVILNVLMEHCPNLEVLDVSNSLFSTDFMMLNIEKLQSSLPRLRILRIANSKFRATQASSRMQAEALGFPNMEELSVAVNPNSLNTGMDDNSIFRLLKKSPKLRLLDLRGCHNLSNEALRGLPVTDLEQLDISQSSVAHYTGIEVIMQKWQHSLKDLDLSWNVYPGASLDLAMGALSNKPKCSQLESLNLSGTSISSTRVQSLLAGCPNLTTLNLASCRGLARGMKRVYADRDLDILRRDIDSIVENDS